MDSNPIIKMVENNQQNDSWDARETLEILNFKTFDSEV